MKTFLTTILILISFIGFGQSKYNYDSLANNVGVTLDTSQIFTLHGWDSSIIIIDDKGEFHFPEPPKLDTIPCIIEYSDTSEKYYLWPVFIEDTAETRRHIDTASYFSGMIGKWGNDTLDRHYDYSVKWMKGYQVLSSINGWIYNEMGYLDENKLPLKNGIIVWITKK